MFPIITSLYLINSKVFKFLSNRDLKNLMKIFLILIIFYFNISNTLKFKDRAEKTNLKRNNLTEVTNFIYKNDFLKDKNLEIFNLNVELSTWFLLKDYKNFSLLPLSFWTPKTNEILEEELISSMKFLKLDRTDFYNLIKNELKSWRFKNEFVYIFFGRKYLANSLVTFDNNASDFEDIEKKYIASNNLIITHQVIIPKTEIRRLLNKFDDVNTAINPDIVILDKDGYLKITELQNNNYCLIFNNEAYKIYTSKKLKSECELVEN